VHSAERPASVQQGASCDLRAGQALRESAEQALMTQHGISDKSLRIPAMLTLSSVIERRMQ
jgi:hypothetical protein